MTKTSLITIAALVAGTITTFAHEAATQGDLSVLADAAQLPANVEKISDVVPGMGEHWADPADLPLGPIYGVYDGKVTFLEFMIDRESLAAGQSYLELASKAGIELPAVDHVDINWEEHGHPGYEVPHYDIHMYFVSHEQHLDIQP